MTAIQKQQNYGITKTGIYTGIPSYSIGLICAIHCKTITNTMVSDEKTIGWEPFSVPLEVAQERITNWIDADPDKPVKPTDMRAFVVRREDFVELLAQRDTEFIRLYLGRKEVPNDADRLHPCLLLVSAAYQHDIHPDAPNPDEIIDLVGKVVIGTGENAVEKTYDVFDFSQGCPPYCDPDSPLFIRPDNKYDEYK